MLEITYNPQIPLNKLQDDDELNGANPYKGTWINHPLKPNNIATRYDVYITTIDKFFLERENEKHTVKEHIRHLQSGKIVPVKPHKRSNPVKIREQILNTSEVDYIVYCVKDMDGFIRYYGEGKETRPNHVNSGISHNYKINEHFFTRGLMKVEIIKQHLSKAQSLAIEKFLIKSHTESELWNIKDYENNK
ncbi:MAG: hypothetical protein RIQ94_3032 [Pseudomonadota bacterium]